MFRVAAFHFFFKSTATTEIYTLSLTTLFRSGGAATHRSGEAARLTKPGHQRLRSEEHTSELQSRGHLVCRLLLEKKKKKQFLTICGEKPKSSTCGLTLPCQHLNRLPNCAAHS